jgi:hypothetical protein
MVRRTVKVALRIVESDPDKQEQCSLKNKLADFGRALLA